MKRMALRRTLPAALLICAGATGMSGCALNTLVWGADGARVIEATEDFIAERAAGQGSDLLCDDADADLRADVSRAEGADWAVLSAGEPERFVPEHWPQQAPLDPQWSISLEGHADDAEPGDMSPGIVFYRETAEGLCVVDVAWVKFVDGG